MIQLDSSGRTLLSLSDGTTMSILSPEECRRSVSLDPFLEMWGRMLGLTEEDWAPPEGKYEVAFLDIANQAPAGEVIVLEWENDRAEGAQYAPQWSVYWVTEDQIAAYVEKVGVK